MRSRILAASTAATIAVWILVFGTACSNNDLEIAPGRTPEWTPNAAVEAVVDGDTIVATIAGASHIIRLIGIDTPETVAPQRPVECFGPQASQYLTELLPPGTEVTIVRDVQARDAYDRLLGYVIRSSDGLFVNLELLAGGYAATLNFPPNEKFTRAFEQAQSAARAGGAGLWGTCGGPNTPLL